MDNTKELISAIEKVRAIATIKTTACIVFFTTLTLTAAIFRVFLMNGFITGFRRMKFS